MSEKVMNNKDLRNIIFSFFRKEPEIICQQCKKVCIWNKKKFRNYVEIPTLDYTVIYYQCVNCFWSGTLRDFL